MNDKLRLITLVIAVLGPLGTLAICLGVTDLGSPMSYAFILWAVSPFAAIFAATRKPRGSTAASVVRLVATLVITAFGLSTLHHGFFVKPDPQSGLLFIFVPLYQWAAFVVAFLMAYLLDRRAR